jgi:hypothetical protein
VFKSCTLIVTLVWRAGHSTSYRMQLGLAGELVDERDSTDDGEHSLTICDQMSRAAMNTGNLGQRTHLEVSSISLRTRD